MTDNIDFSVTEQLDKETGKNKIHIRVQQSKFFLITFQETEKKESQQFKGQM